MCERIWDGQVLIDVGDPMVVQIILDSFVMGDFRLIDDARFRYCYELVMTFGENGHAIAAVTPPLTFSC